MNLTILIAVSIAIGLAGLLLGLFLGCFLGKIGSVHILAAISRFPILIIRSPRKLKDRWKIWQELRDSKKINNLSKQKKITEQKEKVKILQGEIKVIKKHIRHLKWG
jgi:hypothetical protein